MPSPFPGVDPYVENEEDWPDFHAALIMAIRAHLNERLPPQFKARGERRTYLQSVADGLAIGQSGNGMGGNGSHGQSHPARPDIAVLKTVPNSLPQMNRTAVAVPVAQATVLPFLLQERREWFVNVLHTGEAERVIASIEVLSPTNKRPGVGRKKYLQKQEETLLSDVHLLEIDLLRGGAYTVAAPEDRLRAVYGDDWDYVVSLHAEGTEEVSVWVWSLPAPLPVVEVPLTEGYESVPLNLATVFTRAYDEGRYDDLPYRRSPAVSLSPTDATWADALLREKGLR